MKKLSNAKISGHNLSATMETLSVLGSIGKRILRDQGIDEIDDKKNYSFNIRRKINKEVLKRFGEIALYASGINYYFAYPDFIKKQKLYKSQLKGINQLKNRDKANNDLFKFLTLIINDWNIGFKSGVKGGSGNYGSKIYKISSKKFLISVTSTATLKEEAFMRACLDSLCLYHLSDYWNIKTKFNTRKSSEGVDWARAIYELEVKLLKSKKEKNDELRVFQKRINTKLLETVLSESDKEKDKNIILSTQLGKYVPPQIYNALISGKYSTKIKTKRKKLTVFFSDIKNFTKTSEYLQPEDLTSYLNEYFSEMTKIALAYGATIDKYIGDAIMLFFGDPKSKGEKEDAIACIKMSIEMQEKMKKLRLKWKSNGFANPFEIRIGINTGFCNVGNFGSEQRLTYTIIGEAVNIAARLETAGEAGNILISYETYAHVKDLVTTKQNKTIKMKGISKNVKIFEVKSLKANVTKKSFYDNSNLNLIKENEMLKNELMRLRKLIKK